MSVVSDIRAQLTARLEELQPAFDEYREVQDALARLDPAAESRPAPVKSASTRSAARTRKSGSRAQSQRAEGTALTGGARADEALRLVAASPGIKVAELSEKMAIGATYLYRVMPALERAGKVTKVGTGYHPVAEAAD